MANNRSLRATDLSGADWRKSSYSGANEGQCVEIAANLVASHGMVPIRDSKAPTGPILGLRVDAFSSFVAGIKAGQLGTV
ncbi:MULTISPECIES: DUF397 domain-containing protein [Streptomyces]|uniref:DUF397 domain-containing protein n=1 Tax=Streptomyces albus (strain ATCC 21838 / DSM 41398 / FERM P-419 / JCM 4703 / NBRC 107858) TaxID=1081613 RepID=A0A0B5EW54_STRA4|nr:DUF397 domain-containing protein [Streptomyces sp. SCSIO ZS0520]AJE82911.1 hypothetical protein SLNWT_2535 [Streptomyces albus]AOU77222.1 hypothetical protein SLNHY_2531 [Streptomyces albus]AYN33000.1 hypothetical protein DUI70_2498 [Streptomyces albus]